MVDQVTFFYTTFKQTDKQSPPQVVVEKVSNSSIPDIDKRKFLVPSDLTGTGYPHPNSHCIPDSTLQFIICLSVVRKEFLNQVFLECFLP